MTTFQKILILLCQINHVLKHSKNFFTQDYSIVLLTKILILPTRISEYGNLTDKYNMYIFTRITYRFMPHNLLRYENLMHEMAING